VSTTTTRKPKVIKRTKNTYVYKVTTLDVIEDLRRDLPADMHLDDIKIIRTNDTIEFSFVSYS